MGMDPSHLSPQKNVLWIPCQSFSGVIPLTTIRSGTIGTSMAIGLDVDTTNAELVGTAAGVTADRQLLGTPPVKMASSGSGAPEIEEIGTTGLSGMIMVGTGDLVTTLFPSPIDMDLTNEVTAYVHWASEAAAVGNRDITWAVLHNFNVVPGTATVAASATTVAMTVQAPTGTTETYERTSGKDLFGTSTTKLTRAQVNARPILKMGVKMQAFDAAFTENKFFLGLELEYTVRRGMQQSLPQRAR